MEEATFLSNIVSSIQVVHRRRELRACATLQEEAESRPQDQIQLELGGHRRLRQREGRRVAVKDLKTGEETKLDVDGVFIAIGYDPNTKLFQGKLDIEPNGYLRVKNETETSVPGVFAAGDVRDYGIGRR